MADSDQEQDRRGDLYYDEMTMKKVFDALSNAGVPYTQAQDAVNGMQAVGILFRERGKF